MTVPVIENERYQLFLQGSVARWTESGTSDHYFDYTDNYCQWRGAGVVVDKKTGQSTQFVFSNLASRYGSPVPDLKSLVLQTEKTIKAEVKNRPGISHEYREALVQELALSNQESNIVSFVCKRLLDKVEKCTDPIKRIVIDAIPLAELVNAGIIADSSGQIHLGLTTSAGGRL